MWNNFLAEIVKYLPPPTALVDVKWNLPTFAPANISHLRSKYFTAKLFHLPERANFVEKSTHCLGRQMCAFFWRRRRDSNPRAAHHGNTISNRARYDHFDTSPNSWWVPYRTQVIIPNLFPKIKGFFQKNYFLCFLFVFLGVLAAWHLDYEDYN